MVLENNKAKRPQAANNIRRNSTGNLDFNASPELKPLPLPNYLRASMGSCHDFCKYGGMKPEFITQKPTAPLPKKPPVLPDKTSKLPNKSQNNVVNNVIKNATSNVTIQQKTKQKAMIPKHPNDVKSKPLAKEVSSSIILVQPPSRRRYSDVYSQTHSIKNGSNHKAVCLTATATASQSGKRGVSRNASKKDLSQSEKKPHKAETESSFEIPVEKILYIDEMTPCKEADDHSSIQKFSSEETNDKAIDLIDDRFSSYLSLSEDNINCGSTTGSSCSDTLASISITSCETDSDISSNMFKPKKGSCVDEASISITSFKTDSDNSSNMFKSKKGNWIHEASISITSFKTDSDNSSKPKKGSCVDEASISITSFRTDSDNSSNTFKSKKGNWFDEASISITSFKTDSDNSSNMFKSKKVISVDDDCKSTETRNESVQVVLHHQNQEEKKLAPEDLYNDVIEETTRNLVEAGKVKALVSAFEAVISLEDTKSLRTLKA